MPGIVDLLGLALELYVNDAFDNHSALFSDAHLYGEQRISTWVTYTYEPAVQSVPDPGIVPLVGMGLAAVAARGRLGLGGGNAGPANDLAQITAESSPRLCSLLDTPAGTMLPATECASRESNAQLTPQASVVAI